MVYDEMWAAIDGEWTVSGLDMPILADMRYRSEEPLIITLELSIPGDTGVSMWELSRDLLYTGLFRPEGIGDARIRPDGGIVLITLICSDTREEVHLKLPLMQVEKFVSRTYARVPQRLETQHLRIDQQLEALLNGKQQGH